MPMSAKLEIHIREEGEGGFATLTFTPPVGGETQRCEPATIPLDRASLLAKEVDVRGYGEELGRTLFADPRALTLLTYARGESDTFGVPLRIILSTEPETGTLANLRWERLVDPARQDELALAPNVFLRRHISAVIAPTKAQRKRAPGRALVAVANPSGLNADIFAPLDQAAHFQAIATSLAPIPCVNLADGGPVSLSRLSMALRDGYEILYLVCHGAQQGNDAKIWLEGDGTEPLAELVAGSDLVNVFQRLEHPPRLVVIASCSSAGVTGARHTIANGLGPMLSRAGVPAIIALQGRAGIDTTQRFLKSFFDELARSRDVDRAMWKGRRSLRQDDSWWVPTLYSRLVDGDMWWPITPTPEFDQLPVLKWQVESEKCTPIVGPAFNEDLFGDVGSIAKDMATEHRYPLAQGDMSLPRVARFVATQFGRAFLLHDLTDRLSDRLGKTVPGLDGELDLQHAVREAARQRRRSDPAELHRMLAALPCAVYITADPFDALEDALREAGRVPVSDFFRWKEDLTIVPSPLVQSEGYTPSVDRPLVYHLYGVWQYQESVVITEDDYLDFLRAAGGVGGIPPVVAYRLTSNTLLILGFDLEDLEFRVVFREVAERTRTGGGRDPIRHVAVQVAPGKHCEDSNLEATCAYLASYFGRSSVNVYWVSPTTLLQKLEEAVRKGTNVAV